MRRKFTQQEIQLAINLYNNEKQQWEIARELNCSQTAISDILRRNHIKTRVGKKITYTDININFFNKINSEEGAYFLGFLYADGCVQIKNNAYTVSLKLKSNDQIIIEKFRDIMSPSSPIKITKNKGSTNTYSYFRVNQKEICDQLISHGCVPNKSLILEFPTTIPKKLIHHFMRGYSDGDGSIYKNKLQKSPTSKPYINTIWKFVSTKQFCEQTAKILKEELDITCSQSLSRPKTNQITTTLSVGGNLQVRKALDWLYKDATIYLPRKYEKYLEFINSINNKSG
jgi:intein-encoded DNA endonuclease-like protein